MNISMELTKDELERSFGSGHDWHKQIEITIGKEVFSCYVTRTQMHNTMFNSKEYQFKLMQKEIQSVSKRLLKLKLL